MHTQTDRRAERLVASVERSLRQLATERQQQADHAASLRRQTKRMKDRQGNIDGLFSRLREIECRLPALEATLRDRESRGEDTTDLQRETQSLAFDQHEIRELMNSLLREQAADKQAFAARAK